MTTGRCGPASKWCVSWSDGFIEEEDGGARETVQASKFGVALAPSRAPMGFFSKKIVEVPTGRGRQ